MIDAKSFKESAKDRLKEGIKAFASQRDAIQQSGSGVRTKRRRQSKKISKKSKKRKVELFLLTWPSYTIRAARMPSQSWTCFQYHPLRLA